MNIKVIIKHINDTYESSVYKINEDDLDKLHIMISDVQCGRQDGILLHNGRETYTFTHNILKDCIIIIKKVYYNKRSKNKITHEDISKAFGFKNVNAFRCSSAHKRYVSGVKKIIEMVQSETNV